jgi:hypothetical protein
MCQSISERRIAFEQEEWLSEGQMAEAQRREEMEQNILAAIAPLPPNEMQNTLTSGCFLECVSDKLSSHLRALQ